MMENKGTSMDSFDAAATMVGAKKRHGAWQRILFILAAVVVFCVTYALMLHAITMEKESYCGCEAHTHSDACYESVLVCGLEETGSEGSETPEPAVTTHTHSDACYATVTELTCGLEESEGHAHSDACYSTTLTCTDESEGHEHGEACFSTELSCGLEESEGHAHSDSCYTTTTELVCGLEEGAVVEASSAGETASAVSEAAEAHVHTDACYEKQLVCTQKEHEHTLECFSNPNADVESAAIWEATLPADDQMTDVWADDLLLVAESQMGYTESSSNYVVVEDDKTKGYTRYGAWYGDRYGDWCAMFVSFCLHYAGIPAEDMPRDANCQNWIKTLSAEELDLFVESGGTIEVEVEAEEGAGAAGESAEAVDEGASAATPETASEVDADLETKDGAESESESATESVATIEIPFEPAPGDLIFFDWNADGVSDHVGIVSEFVAASEETPAKAKTIEGNTSNMVAEREYDFDDTSIMGYAMLPENPELEAESELDSEEAASALSGDEAATAGDAVTLAATKTVETTEGSEGDSAETTEDIVHEEESVTGEYWHSPKYKYYEVSARRVTQSDIMTFPLIPSSEYSEDWTPNTTSWSAKVNANYLAAYCAECFVLVSSTGAGYDSYTMENSRFATAALRNQLAGVLAHSYPFLTADEMRAELTAAYEAGEIGVDVSACAESEFMAATQAAIWQLLFPSMDFTKFSAFEDYGTEEYTSISIKADTPAGCSSSAQYDAHCEAIMQWLMGKTVEEDLEVASYEYEVTQDEYGLYTLSVDGVFNRPVIAGEVVELQLVADDRASAREVIATGAEGFDIQISGLTEEELLDAIVSLDVSGKRMQAYYFENASYQDLISGQWEYYDADLSFQVTSETTSVSVKKHWAEGVDAETPVVEAKLYANGTRVGNPVILSADNDWTYTWPVLEKRDALGNVIDYTVRETPLAGYYSSVMAAEGEGSKALVWQEADAFEAGGQYLLVSDVGGFAAYRSSSGKLGVTWTGAHPEDYSACDKGLIWTAQQAEDGRFYLYNESIGAALGYFEWLGDAYVRSLPYTENTTAHPWLTFAFEEGLLKAAYGDSTDFDFTYIGTNSSDTTANFRDYTGIANVFADEMTLYELVEIDVPSADESFVLTNSKIPAEVELISVSVEKQWVGRDDGAYPASAMVQLLQGDAAYGDPVVVSEETAWKYTWASLPATNADGTSIAYTVEEVDLENYAASTVSTEAEGSLDIVLTNTWAPEKVSLTLQKADEDDVSMLLPGAEFELYWAPVEETWDEASGEFIPGTDGVYGLLVGEVVVDEAGTASIDELVSGGQYYLVETRAPYGYNVLGEAIGFTVEQREQKVELTVTDGAGWVVAEDGAAAVLTVKNGSGYELPETGGVGRGVCLLAGGAFVAIGLFGIWRNSRRGRAL